MNKFLKRSEQKGITLIALIITIVVLLILAVVTIRSVQGDGIVQYAHNAKTDYQTAEGEEETKIGTYLDVLDSEVGGLQGTPDDKDNENSEDEVKEYKVGEEVTIQGEKFYVIEDSDKTQLKVKLLAKDCININTKKQSTSAGNVQFSSISYWKEGATTPFNIEEPEPIPDTHIVAKAAYDYGANLGGIGRLMTLEESNVLSKQQYKDILFGTNGKSSSQYLKYWLGYAYNNQRVSIVKGNEKSLYYEQYSYTNSAGVRPVIEILKSKVSIIP